VPVRGMKPGTPSINHARRAFIENKAYRKLPRRFGNVVNRNAGLVYQTDAYLNLVFRLSNARQRDETVQSTSMFKKISLAFLAGAGGICAGLHQAVALDAAAPLPEPMVIYADPSPPRPAPLRVAAAERPNLGGGFIEFLFGDGEPHGSLAAQPPSYPTPGGYDPRRGLAPPVEPQAMRQQEESIEAARPAFDPKYEKQLVDYHGKEAAGTIVIDTPNKFLYLVEGDGRALRYGIGVGRPGFTWSGVKQISAKKEWPDWTPPPEMLVRRPDLPRHMEGGPQNPLGARAMYLGSSLYRIHGSNEPWTIGTNVSSGCIRMRNEDVIDLYGRVNVGARVIVI
jgi:lipoprotein-anchoring transpeptidase ErfK/SrfK